MSDDQPEPEVSRPLLPLTTRWLAVSFAILLWTTVVRHTEVPGINMLGFTPGLLIVDLLGILIRKLHSARDKDTQV
jgi:hypothetical protein